MISPASFNYYLSALEELNNYTGAVPFPEEVLNRAIASMLEQSEDQQPE